MKYALLPLICMLSFVACQPPALVLDPPAVTVAPPSKSSPSPPPPASVSPAPVPIQTPLPSPAVPSATPLATVPPVIVFNEAQISAHFVGQLFYQTDCLAGQVNCSRSAYESHWKGLGFSESDQSKLAQWSQIRAKYDITRPIQSNLTGLVEPLVHQNKGGNLWDRVRSVSLISKTLSQFTQGLPSEIAIEDKASLSSMLNYFSDRFFKNWWEKTGEAEIGLLVKSYKAAFKTHKMSELIKDINGFYQGPADPLGSLQFHLMLQAPGAEQISLAEQILNHGLIEVSPSQNPRSQMDVMIHEMTHYLFKQMPPQAQQTLQNFFASQSEPEAMSAYHLLDEVLATGFGNGLVNQKVLNPSFFSNMLTESRSFFNDDFIDLGGKALFQSGWLEKSLTLTDTQFLKGYYQALTQSLNLNHPLPGLRHSALYIDDLTLKSGASEYQARLKPWALSLIVGGEAGPAFFERYPRLNGSLWFGSDLSGLEDWRSLLGESAYQAILSSKQKSFIYAVKHPQGRWLYVFKGQGGADYSALMKSLFAQSSHFEGLL